MPSSPKRHGTIVDDDAVVLYSSALLESPMAVMMEHRGWNFELSPSSHREAVASVLVTDREAVSMVVRDGDDEADLG